MPADKLAMSRPRQVFAKQFYLVNRRCTQRQFLLRPDDDTNNAFIYCLAEAAQRYGIDVVLPVAESNHHHTIIYDRHGRYPAFIEHFHKMLARSQNARRGRWENFWSSEQVCVVRLVNRADVLAKLAYAATNPVKDRLVERVHQWPGVNGYVKLLAGRPLTAKRPYYFFRASGSMPDSVTLELVVPPELGSRDEFLSDLRKLVETIEKRVADERRRTGSRVVGRRRVLEQSWRSSPTSLEPRRNLRPQFAARDEESRIAVLVSYREFLMAYRIARIDWLGGLSVAFPPGTYWLQRFAGVPIATR